MQHLPELLGIAATIAVGAASPGPSFVLVACTAAGTGRGNGLLAAAGMALGGSLFAVLSLLGLHSLLLAVPSLYLALKVAGGLYLAWLGWRIFRGASQPLAVAIADDGRPAPLSGQTFLAALTTQVSNPKTAIVYASVFAAFLPADAPLSFKVLTALTVFLIEGGWYMLVALLLSAAGPRAAYLKAKLWIDRSAGALMAVFGLKLAATLR